MRLPGTVWLIGFISLLNDSASEMIYPLVPLYLASVLGAGPQRLGLIEGLAEATSSLFKLISGRLMDRTGKSKPWVVAGYSLAGACRPLLSWTTSWGGVLCLRFADRLGKGLRSSPRDALLAASVEPGQRGLAFGFHRAMDNAGAVVGPLLAALLLHRGYRYQDIFTFTLVPGVLCLLLTLLLPERAPKASPPSAAALPAPGPLPRVFWRYLGVLALFTLGNSSNMFLLLRARQLGLSESQVPALWAAVSFTAAVFSAPLSALSDRYGRGRLIVGGWWAYSLFYLMLGCLSETGGLVIFALFSCYGLFLAATEGVEKALVADLAPPERLGTAYGWFHLVSGLTLLPASLLFGWFYAWGGALPAFGFSAGCSAAAGLGMLAWVGLPGRSAR
jgi:MFS family permease